MEHGLNKTLLHTALLALSFPFSLYGLGLGQMTVQSSLDQPFLAEIDVLDIGSLPITSIKVGVADPENFEEIGLDRAAVLSLLQFKLEKNAQGKLVVRVQSTERMVDPYMELVVDMAWPKGQLYKAYTVLLDPPGYQLVLTTIQGSPTRYRKTSTYSNQPGVINKTIHTTVAHNPPLVKDRKKQTTYGPTISNENVWQIAQRYKTSEIILPQVVLALVGANPEAFKDGNLNGLKAGVRLIIPATQEISYVPAELATEEVMAHDKAWNDKSSINHVINPPYIHSQKVNDAAFVGDNGAASAPIVQNNSSPSSSTIPAIPKFNAQSIMDVMPQLLPVSNQDMQTHKIPQSTEHYSRTKAELDITAAAVESVRESNALLMEQLHLLQEQNKQLQLQLHKRDQEMELMRVQIQEIVKQRLAVAAQTSSPDTDSTSLWLPIFLLLLAAGGGGLAYWYFKLRDTEDETITYTSEPLMDPKLSFDESVADTVIDEPTQTTPADGHETSATATKSSESINTRDNDVDEVSKNSVQLQQSVMTSEVFDGVDDSALADNVIETAGSKPAQVAEQSYAADESDPRVSEFFAEQNLDNVLDYVSDAVQPGTDYADEIPADATEINSPLKSFKALDTLLALARTYASMDDFESARSSLEEVITYGNDEQKHEALRLLEDIKNK